MTFTGCFLSPMERSPHFLPCSNFLYGWLSVIMLNSCKTKTFLLSFAVFVIQVITDRCGTYFATFSVIFSLPPSGRRVFGQLHPEHLVGSVPTLQRHRCYRPVAALQCGGEAVQGRRPPLPHRLLAALQEDTAGHPAGNLCELN